MTREEAIHILDNLKPTNVKSSFDAYIVGKALTMAIEALKQEPILDKIRAEIEGLDGRYVIGDYAMYGESSPKYVRSWEVLQIIDKYKAESEG